ncbi:SAM-dependent methyltransferase [Actinomadura hibisca]|uniref:SAM-dependent methyltransferase n=1 Tax=Actinomadura hibisca TaxID=68565 RepID=UPI000AF7D91C|nr:SAM-dependent methyltransferase [Actinomadura hibisca]
MEPDAIDPSRPAPARIYDYFLGGKDNFESDRAVAEQLIALDPEVVRAVRENRRFLGAAVRHLVREEGVRQFLDIGAGLPTQDNVHQVAHRDAPDARVVYVDNDPMVLTHGRALLDGGNTTIVQADLRDAAGILDHPEVQKLIDFTEPVAILLVAVLHFIRDEEDPASLVATLRDALPPGGFLVLTHGTADGVDGKLKAATEAYRPASSQLSLRSRDEVEPFFGDLELLAPGLTWIQDWWPPTPITSTEQKGLYAAVARKNP